MINKPTQIKKLTVYWMKGEREVLEGVSAGAAFIRAGYKINELLSVDFIANGDDHAYTWIDGHWVKKVEPA